MSSRACTIMLLFLLWGLNDISMAYDYEECAFLGVTEPQCVARGCLYNGPNLQREDHRRPDPTTPFHCVRRQECGYPGIDAAACEERGCAFSHLAPRSVDPWCYHRLEREECGWWGIKEGECRTRGCEWAPVDENSQQPWCFTVPKSRELQRSSDLARLVSERLKAQWEAERWSSRNTAEDELLSSSFASSTNNTTSEKTFPGLLVRPYQQQSTSHNTNTVLFFPVVDTGYRPSNSSVFPRAASQETISNLLSGRQSGLSNIGEDQPESRHPYPTPNGGDGNGNSELLLSGSYQRPATEEPEEEPFSSSHQKPTGFLAPAATSSTTSDSNPLPGRFQKGQLFTDDDDVQP